MNTRTIAVAVLASLSLNACAAASSQNPPTTFATATLTNSAGQAVGNVEIVKSGLQVVIRANVTGQAAGEHGIHLHTTGVCEAPGFTSAGAHLNPADHQHGSLNPAGPHIGDLPNITVGSGGYGTIVSQLAGAAGAILDTIFDADGTAIVMHAGPDDYKTDPSGNSGGRIACGVLKRFPAMR